MKIFDDKRKIIFHRFDFFTKVILAAVFVLAVSMYFEFNARYLSEAYVGFFLWEWLGITALVTLLVARLYIVRSNANAKNLVERVKSRQLEINKIIINMTTGQLEGNGRQWIFERMLDGLLQLTESEYGFVGKVVEEKGVKFLRTFSITDIAWNDETSALYNSEGMELRNLKTLWGAVITQDGVVISNDPANDPRSGGVPHGHPPMNCFLGLPIKFAGEVIAVLGVANKDGGYKNEDVDEISTFINACGLVIWAEELKQSNEWAKEDYMRLFAAAPQMAVYGLYSEENHTLTDCNELFCQKMGYSKAEILSLPVEELLTPDSLHEAKEDISLGDAWKGSYEVPRNWIKSDGTILITIGSVVPVIRNGITIGVQGTFRDVTEIDLLRSETVMLSAQLQKILSSMSDALLVIDQEGLIVEANNAAERIFRVDFADKERMHLSEFLSPASLELLNDKYKFPGKEVKEEVIVFNEKVEGCTRDHNKIYLDVSVSSTRYANKDCYALVAHDMTLYEKTLAIAEANAIKVKNLATNLSEFIRSAAVPIIGIDHKGNINEWNRKAEQTFGVSRQDVIGKNLMQHYVPGHYKVGFENILKKALEGEETENYEVVIPAKEELSLEMLLNITPRYNSSGTISGVIIACQDISKLRQKERELARSDRLDSLGKLTGGIAHDFNNLLAVISGTLEYMDGYIPVNSVEFEELLEDAKSAAKDAAALTHGLLAFARQQHFELQVVDLRAGVKNSVRLLKRTLKDGIVLNLECQNKPIMTLLDPAQLESCIINLCVNSQDAIAGNGVINIDVKVQDRAWVEKRLGKKLDYMSYAQLIVEDSGSGIADSVKNRIFEPFYTTKTHGAGTGLGLSMVHGFVEQSGGFMHACTSDTLGGARFELYLPISEIKPAQLINRKDRAKIALENYVIMLVEDNYRLRKVAARTLKRLGMQVIEAETADEALIKLDEVSVCDILFSDIQLPGKLNGRQLSKLAKDKYPKIKVLLTSGYEEPWAQNGDVEKNGEVLKKPYSKADLERALTAISDN